MKHKKPLMYMRLVTASLLLVGLIAIAGNSTVHAVRPTTDTGSSTNTSTANTPATNGSGQVDGLTPACQNQKGCTTDTTDPAISCGTNSCDLIKKYLNPAIQLFSIIVGVVVVISIILGGIQYSTSAGDPQKAAKAKHRITMTIFALIAYIFLFAFLQFLIPGGIR